MDLGLQNKVALVAGSSRGIGKAVAMQLLREGGKVCITGRDEAHLSQTLGEFQSEFGSERVTSFAGDLICDDVIDRAFTALRRKWEGIDILIANLGSGKGKRGWDLDKTEWERLFQLNLWGSVRLAQAAIPRLIQRQGGSIIFVSSIVGIEATPAPLPYSAAKAALINYSKNLSEQVAGNNIRVNCVAPGNILFPGGSWEERLNADRQGVMQMIAERVPLGRFGVPEEIASLVAFLCSDAARFMTGACIVADGGQTRTI